MPVNIKGKMYMTVAERVQEAHADENQVQSIITEFVSNEPRVLFKATVTLKDGRIFTGYSAADPSKSIEKQSPYEIAETSAVGRALGFAGFGSVEGIATADEMVKATTDQFDDSFEKTLEPTHKTVQTSDLDCECEVHNVPMHSAISTKTGAEYWSHKSQDGKICFGKGWK